MSFTKEIHLCTTLKILWKDHVFNLCLPLMWMEKSGKLSIRTATLNGSVSKTKPVSGQGGEMSWDGTNSSGPFPQRETYYSCFACFTDIWWFYRLKQLVKLSKPTQSCLPFCKVLIFCCIALAKIMYKLTSVLPSYVSIITDKLLCKTLLSDQ